METTKLIILSDLDSFDNLNRVLLSDFSKNLHCAKNFDELLILSRKVEPDLILFNPNFETGKVTESLKMVRDIPGFTRTPILFLADSDNLETVQSLENWGVFDYLHPHLPESLVRNRLKSALKSSSKAGTETSMAHKLLQVVSHDLSNFFQNIQIYFASVEKNRDKEKVEARRRRARLSLEEMMGILEKVKDFERSRSSVIELKLVPVCISDCLKDVRELFADRLEKKGITLDLQIHDDPWVLADAVTFKHQVVGNLLANAIKFSYENSSIQISAKAIGENVEIVFKDSGIGMNEEKKQKLFSELVESTMGTKGEKGTGFGVHLMCEFVAAYEGSVKVSSVCESDNPHDHGTEFSVTIPKAEKKDKKAS